MNDNYKYGLMDGYHGDEHLQENMSQEYDDEWYDEFEPE